MFRPLRPQPSFSRRLLLPALAGLVLANLPGVVPGAIPPAMAQTISIEVGQFEPALSPYGRWFDHPAYGRVWQPAGIGPDWQPYTDGYWAYMDDDTWLWVANEPWGWAPYHYGRWLFVDAIGWVWRPGRVWAPAWVVWRFGGGYYGWAPAPFEDDWDEGRFRGANWGNRVPAQQWIFVRSRAFTHHHIREVMVPNHSNRRLFDETRDITRTGQRHHDQGDGRDRQPDNGQGGGRRHPDAVIQGPRGRDIRRETGRPLAPARVTESNVPGPAVQTGDEVRLYRPDHPTNNNQTRPDHGPGPSQAEAPDAGRPGNARPERRPGEATPSGPQPGKGNQRPPRRQEGDQNGGSGSAPIVPIAPSPPTIPHKPQVTGPDTPEVAQPEVERPEVRRPGIEKSDVWQPGIGQPEMRQPEVRQPEVRIPDVRMPEAPQPEARMPEVRMPEARMPEARMPEVQQPEARMPEAPQPEAGMPEVRMPEVRMPEVRMPDVRMPEAPQPDMMQPPEQPRHQEPPHQQKPRKGGKPDGLPPQDDVGN